MGSLGLIDPNLKGVFRSLSSDLHLILKELLGLEMVGPEERFTGDGVERVQSLYRDPEDLLASTIVELLSSGGQEPLEFCPPGGGILMSLELSSYGGLALLRRTREERVEYFQLGYPNRIVSISFGILFRFSDRLVEGLLLGWSKAKDSAFPQFLYPSKSFRESQVLDGWDLNRYLELLFPQDQDRLLRRGVKNFLEGLEDLGMYHLSGGDGRDPDRIYSLRYFPADFPIDGSQGFYLSVELTTNPTARI